jgi:hypothetical protein
MTVEHGGGACGATGHRFRGWVDDVVCDGDDSDHRRSSEGGGGSRGLTVDRAEGAIGAE